MAPAQLGSPPSHGKAVKGKVWMGVEVRRMKCIHGWLEHGTRAPDENSGAERMERLTTMQMVHLCIQWSRGPMARYILRAVSFIR